MSTNRWVLVTGASSGIGSDFARVFAREGYSLLITARSRDRLDALAQELRREHSALVRVFPCDLSLSGAAKALVRALEEEQIEVEVLVNNAGVGLLGPFVELDAEKQSEMIHLNVLALTELTRLLAPAMVRRGSGGILNIGSTAAFQPGPLMAVYFATKAYVLSFSAALQEELSATGVTVTCLCPGPVDTPFLATARAADAKLTRWRKPMKSLIVAEEGYQALQRGATCRVTGRLNRWMAFSTRFAPLRVAAKVAKNLLQP
ncbi:SDR family oxidoreductase [uncultured Thiodictyon sp.]|uniref:SDR family NAD(P)-dependent oxidoreductase n=1 Tax=uncultured Thiodictyon sp. TaxID=1846217 RepID=UPI0025E382F6|nr:SDR family oxidoreductase [uncultured Thiodictyon sp.]